LLKFPKKKNQKGIFLKKKCLCVFTHGHELGIACDPPKILENEFVISARPHVLLVMGRGVVVVVVVGTISALAQQNRT
jgi:hypothetical protein